MTDALPPPIKIQSICKEGGVISDDTEEAACPSYDGDASEQ